MKITKATLKQIIKEEIKEATDHPDNRDKIAMSKMAADSPDGARQGPQPAAGGGTVVSVPEDTVYLQPTGKNVIFSFYFVTAEGGKQRVSATLHPDSVQELKDAEILK